MSSARQTRTAASRAVDRRVLRTRALLHEALFQLIRERDYHRISVSQILERANVGRSTFYMHFRDKEALFASAIREMLESVRAAATSVASLPAERITGFALPLLAHIERHRDVGGARMERTGRAVLHRHVRGFLAHWIADEIDRDKTELGQLRSRLPPDLLAEYVASTFILLLDWWVERRCVPSAAEVDALFRSLVSPAVGPAPMLQSTRSRLTRGRHR